MLISLYCGAEVLGIQERSVAEGNRCCQVSTTSLGGPFGAAAWYRRVSDRGHVSRLDSPSACSVGCMLPKHRQLAMVDPEASDQALRAIGALAGVQPQDYAHHSLRFRGPTAFWEASGKRCNGKDGGPVTPTKLIPEGTTETPPGSRVRLQ